jgi:hypothetical protein
MYARVGVLKHGTKLAHAEMLDHPSGVASGLPLGSHAFMSEKDRASGVELDQNGDQQQQRRKKDKRQTG